MIILLPNTSEQTITIMPRRSLSLSDSVVLNIRRDGDGLSEDIVPTSIVSNEDFTDLSISSNILTEGSTYFIEITVNGNLAYRDKVYSTSQNDYTIKHKVSQTKYQTYSSLDDNTYII